MLFNSIDFAIFLPVVFAIYWLAQKLSLQIQNLILLIASYFFYGLWDWRFLLLVAFSTVVDYTVANSIEKSSDLKTRKNLLLISVFVNLGLLGFFKYYNFFIDNFTETFSFFGQPIGSLSLNIILPVGISFYTFQTLSYTIDVYRKKLKPTKDFISFATFVSFFPQLVAGPIERATNLLPQFYTKRTFNYAKSVDGMRQILWGLFKKVVIADNAAQYANQIFNNSDDYSGSTLVLGAVMFAFQIYGDFSGYSDVAIGTARLFGFELKQNFAFPYFSRDIAEFWRRWHISLSTWFRDYVYFPLGGSRVGSFTKVRNTFIIFLISGFWHGSNWTFIVWGLLNAIYFLPLLLTNNNRNNIDVVAQGKMLPSLKDFLAIIYTFSLTTVAWVFFRADNLSHAFSYLSNMFSVSLFSIPEMLNDKGVLITLFYIFMMLVIEWFGREQEYALASLGIKLNKTVRYTMYYAMIIVLLWFGGEEQAFVYFQF
ncbi:MAG: MBOAT family protein [Ichthyobacteriaceae bacterium]|nr:MBOAT family protein [Ichthyobacteriaceae bacterium]